MTEAPPRSHQSPVKYQPNIGPIRPITEQILEFQVQLKDRQQTGSDEIPHRTASLWPVGPCKSQGGASRRRRDYTVLRAACRELALQIERELRFGWEAREGDGDVADAGEGKLLQRRQLDERGRREHRAQPLA